MSDSSAGASAKEDVLSGLQPRQTPRAEESARYCTQRFTHANEEAATLD